MSDRLVFRSTRRAVKSIAWLAALVLVGLSFAYSAPAHAQAIVLSVNGDPITNLDIDQRMKLLRVLRKPAAHDAAVESLISDRLKLHETAKFGIKVGDSDIGQEIARVASEMKVTPEALVANLQRGGVNAEHFKPYFSANLAFTVLVQALNKGVEASESEIRAELAKQGGKSAAGSEYKVRQVIFTVPNSASVPEFNNRAHQAEQLRSRFTDCESGIPVASAMPDVVVREPLTRSSAQMSDGLRELLDKTPVGHLTPPQRGTTGLEMVAVCSKSVSKDDTAVRSAISTKLLAAHLESDADKRLKEMRSRAVIVKPNG